VRKLIVSTTSHARILLGMSQVTCPHILAPPDAAAACAQLPTHHRPALRRQ
jgi:hypothetical protein